MSILKKQFEAEFKDYINFADLIKLISDLTDTPVIDVEVYLLNAHIDDLLDAFWIDERMNFCRINLDEFLLEDHEAYMINFKKSDLSSFAPIAKYSIFNAVDNDYYENNILIDDDDSDENEFLTIDQTVEYIRSVTGLTYNNKILGRISERGQITTYFYNDSYIAKRIGKFYCEEIKGYFYFKNLGSFLARNDTRAFIGENSVLDIIYVRSLLSQKSNVFKPEDAVNLYNFKTVDFESAKDALITSIHCLNFRFLKSEIDNYLRSIGVLRRYVPKTAPDSMLNVNSKNEVFSDKKENKELKGLQVGTKYISGQLEDAQDTIKKLSDKVYKLEEQKTLSKSKSIKPKSGISIEKQQAKEAARILAKMLWKNDSSKEIKMLMMCAEVYSNLYESEFCDQLPDQPKSIKSWIASEAPGYARESGRPSEK